MGRLSRLIMVRHGETSGQSSVRYHGATDVPLSELGRVQARDARGKIPGETFEAIWTSPLSRAWETAEILVPGRTLRVEPGFGEIDFGRWEGLTREEIETVDPDLYAFWQSGRPGFEFPEGETRSCFRSRVEAGLSRLRRSGVQSAIIVAHKGVLRTLLELVSGQTLPDGKPELGGVFQVYRDLAGAWKTGRHGSDASCTEEPIDIPMNRNEST